MSRVYHNWEKLVEAVLKREELRQIAFSESFNSSISPEDFSSRFSSLEDMPGASRISNETFDPVACSSQSNFFYRDIQPIEFEEIIKAIPKYQLVEQARYGMVLKGWIDEHTLTASKPGSGMAVVVKCNHSGQQELPEWLEEIKYLSQLNHPNLVKPIGYCLKEHNKILVYEFMPKGSLDNYLYRSHLTTKCNVFGFGVVLLELLSGLPVIDNNRPRKMQNLVEWAKPYLGNKRKLFEIMDTRLAGQYSHNAAYTVVKLASRCLSALPKERPRMAEVVVALEQL